MLQFSVGKVLVRDRTRSVAEEVNGARAGDAAFANYVWMAGYTLRMPRRKGEVDAALTPRSASRSRRPSAASVTEGISQTAHQTFRPFRLKTLDGKTRHSTISLTKSHW